MSETKTNKTGRSPKPAGRPKDADKAAAILEAARGRFLRDGLRATSVEAVAADAGVSKVTVYSHFGDKENLFLASMRDTARRLGWDCGEGAASAAPRTEDELRRALRDKGVALLKFLSRPELVSCERVVMAEAQHSASIGRRFWEFGPSRAVADVADLLRAGESAGLIRLRKNRRGPAAEEAAERLIGMWKGLDETRSHFGLPRRQNTPAALRRHVGGCVDDFLAARAASPRAGGGV